MVRITVGIRNKALVHLHATGHANAGTFGKDIICASVSLLLSAVCKSIEIIPGIQFTGGAEKEGELLIDIQKIPNEFEEEVRGITKVLLLGAEQVQRESPHSISVHIDTL